MNDQIEVTENKETGHVDVAVKDVVAEASLDLELAPLRNFLGSDDDEDTRKLSIIREFLEKEADSKSNGEILTVLRNIESRLSAPRLGETRTDKIYRYVNAQRLVDDAEKQRDAFLR